MKKNEKGIAVISLLLIIAIIIVAIVLIKGINKDGGTTILSKESRSSYIPKCSTISYTSLARNPNLYINNDYTFTGEVIQVINGPSNEVQLRVNVTPKRYEYINETYYEDTMFVTYKYSSSSESRILEDDIITIYGPFAGIYSYESIMGTQVSIPMIKAMYIDIKS